MSAPFVKLLRGADTERLLAEHPSCFLVLTLIALRARREVPEFNPHGLTKGEALVGDYAAAGLERQPFRTALSNLQKWGFITTRPTTKGTIAKLSKSALYDINSGEANHQVNQPSTTETTSDQPAANQQLTTNKNVMKEKEGKNGRMEERKDVAQPADQPVFLEDEKPVVPKGPPKFFPDAAQVFTIAGFSKFITDMGYGDADRGLYLPEIQRKAVLMQQERDETGWQNFVLDYLKKEKARGNYVSRELPAEGGGQRQQPTNLLRPKMEFVR